MAKIPLRNYLHEIEELIERELYDEAIAHCRHILEVYPKHVDTYRTLGKTFLEAKRYSDAADILQRVLSSLPADFIANLGMSIIREDEGNLGDAIWHMERAFEIQPSNSTIQAEMRRLYGRRDGIEPPRVRLTRGALARMYVKGGLIPQAIAEIRAALAEDSDRADLQVLLANVYYSAGQRVEAAEICSALLKKLPYCYDANRILAEILDDSERSEEAKTYWERVYALDPYAAYVSPQAPTPDQVQALSVLVEKLDYRPENNPNAGPQWAASLGVDLNEERPAEEEIPDWMREAGWGPASGEAIEGPLALPDDEPPAGPAPSGDLDTPDLPDWLKDMNAEVPTWEAGAEAGGSDTPDFLAGDLEVEEELPAPASDMPDWLKEFESEAGAEADAFAGSEAPDEMGAAPTYDLPDWMDTAEETAAPAAEADLPDWLKDLDPGAPEEGPALEGLGEASLWEPVESPAEAGEQAGWTPESAWETDESVAEGASEPPTAPFTPEEEEAAFQWLNDQAPAEAQEEAAGAWNTDEASFAVENRPAEGEPEDELPDWLLESEAETAFGAAVFQMPEPAAGEAEEPAPPDFLSIDEGPIIEGDTQPTHPQPTLEPASGTESAPESVEPSAQENWAPEQESAPFETGEEPAPISSIEETETPEPAAGFAPTPVEAEAEPPAAPQESPEPPAGSDFPALSPDAEAEAFAWLESLAARQGAEEALLLKPEERLETPPDWIQEAIHQAEDQAGSENESEAFAPATAAGAELLGFSQPSAPQVPEEPEAEAALLEEAPEEAPLSTPEVAQGRMEEEAWQAEAGVEHEAARPEPGEELGGGEAAESPETFPSEPVTSETIPAWAAYDVEPEEPAPAVEEPPAAAPISATELQQGIQEEQAWQAVDEAPEPVAAESAVEGEPAVSEESAPVETAPEEAPFTEAAYSETAPAEAHWEEEAEAEPAPEAPAAGEEQPPELPAWLAGLEEEAGAPEEVPWTPPEEIRPRPLIDLNRAALNELERLPGIGFIRAQSIIQHRERNGDFSSLDDLLQVPGIDADTLAGVKNYLFVELPEPAAGTGEVGDGETPAEAAEIENIVPEQVRLIQARNALAQGRRDESLQHYNTLIREERLLQEVIQDLHEALYRFPVDVEIWQALGDAYMRAGQLKEALDAYTKAEELLR